MKKLLLVTAALAVLPLTAQAQDMTPISEMPAGVYEVDKTHASITWEVSHLGLSDYTARFTEFDSEITLDPVNLENSTVRATINPLSIKTDYPNPEKEDFDKKLATGTDWFNVGEYPEIKFVSTSVKKTGDNTGEVIGNLTLLGVTKPVTLEVEFNGAYAEKPFAKVPALGFSADATISRSDWGFGTYVPMIGDEVEIDIEAEYHLKQDEPAAE